MSDTRRAGYEDTQAGFNVTQWGMVRQAADQNTPGGDTALQELCKIYWPPIYAYLRRQGRTPEDAKDLTQGFFSHLLAKGSRLESATPERGRFRSFLLSSLNHYVQNEAARQHAQKRGGKFNFVPIQTSEDEETRYGVNPASNDTPDKAFDRCWASTLMNRVLEQLRDVYRRNGQEQTFEVLQPFIAGESERGDYATAAQKLSKNEQAVRTAASRLRREFAHSLRREIGRTVTRAADVEAEITHLFHSFS